MIFERFLGTAEVMRVLDERAFVQAMLDVEGALARAQAHVGAIPARAAAAITAACQVERLDLAALEADGARAGSLAIPLVKSLTAAVAADDAEAALHVHWGATSQDVLDTAQVLVARRALALVDRDLSGLVAALLRVHAGHGDAPMLGRTLLQPAQVISFGFKLAGWIAPLVRTQQRLREAGTAALQVQLGGAVGTLAVMGAHGEAVRVRLADELALRAPPAAWHTQRDEPMALACELGVLVGALGKIARDIALMAQGEVGELAEPSGAGRGGSSAMPHKRNPVGSMVALAAAARAPQRVAALLAAMPQEHERGLGNWQAELAEFTGLLASAHGAVAALRQVAEGLRVDEARMRGNIDDMHGLVFAEALSMRATRALGKTGAHRWVEALSQRSVASGMHLRDVALAALAEQPAVRAEITDDELRALFDAATPAAHAAAQAAPRIAALAAQSEQLSRDAPWGAWLPAPAKDSR